MSDPAVLDPREGAKAPKAVGSLSQSTHRPGSDIPFYVVMTGLGGVYIVLILAMLVADLSFTSLADLGRVLESREVRFSIWLSLITCTLSAVLSVFVAVPIGYLMSRHESWGKRALDALLDVPIVLPPLVIGLSLLILFQTKPGKWLNEELVFLIDLVHFNEGVAWLVERVNAVLGAIGLEALAIPGFRPIRGITYDIPAVILSQFAVACAFAVRTMRVSFDQIDHRREQVALTLGCRRGQAFFRVVLPEARAGIVAALTLAWARSLGEFGPILVFAGSTRLKTEVLPTTVFLELSVGDIEAAVPVSLWMVFAAMLVLVITRLCGLRRGLP